MYVILALVSVIPLIAYLICRRTDGDEARVRTALRVAGLFGLGLLAASPFVTSRGVGTGEAYNYSLALADAVTQLRAGHLPLIGQTEYAFNGRVHPIRTAPYLFYLAGGADFLTFHRLNFWQLQNLTLALSLVATAFTAYAGLRWGTGCSRVAAFLLAAVYLLSPALLGACTLNLFMTVHVAVFAPLALGACLRQARQPEIKNDFLLALALAAAWLAHPPVAAWLTLAIGILRLVLLARDHRWRHLAGLAGAALSGLVLAAFVFVSAGTLNSDLRYFSASAQEQSSYVSLVWTNLRSAFPANLLPVSDATTALGDLQLGYGGWLLLALAAAALARADRAHPPFSRRLPGIVLLGLAALVLLLVFPVPALTSWLWVHLPADLTTLTNVWPMQRLYLIASLLATFAAAFAAAVTPLRRSLLFGVLGAAVAWSGLEAVKFLRKGYALAWNADMTSHAHLGSNLDLTITSYAFLPLPRTFVHGVMDPLMEFKVMKRNGEVIASPLLAAQARGRIVDTGRILASGTDLQKIELDRKLVLQPGKRYLLNVDFHIPPVTGALDLAGASLRRHYLLPSSGESAGFGMAPNNSHSLSLWTAGATPEEVEIRLYVNDWGTGAAPAGNLADLTIQEADPADLPVVVTSLLPLRFTVTSPEDGCFVVTPRSFIAGYRATVNGAEVRPEQAPEGQLMLPVPRGPAEVELRYVGGRLLIFSFWLSAAGWAVVLLGFMGAVAGFDCLAWAARAGSRSAAAARGLWAHKWIWAGGLAAAGVATFAVGHRRAYLEAVGPIRVTFLLPSGPIGQTQPILVTGKTGAATNVFVTCLDATHLQIGADIWGTLHQSPPLEIDYAQKHEIVVNSSALYPLDHPRTRRLDPWARERLRDDFRVEFDGVTVLAAKAFAFESTVQEVTVGENRVGGSYGAAPFLGEILAAERLPLPKVLALSPDQRLHLRVVFPEDRNGHTETLVAVGRNGADGICAVRYLADRRVRFLWQSREGEVWSSTDAAITAGAHELELTFAPGPGHLASQWVLDGSSVLGRARTVPPTRILLVSVGHVDAASGADVRFSGDFEARRSGPAGAMPAKDGPIRLVLNFPTDRTGYAEPLLTTGRNRSGDFAYVTYVDAGHVRFGLDHWGKGGRQSDPIAVDYQSPHEIRIRFGSLFPGPADEAAWAGVPPDLRQRYQNEMEIVLDGKTVLSAPFPAYPTTTEEITPGRNAIGGSSCEPLFSGELFSCDRLGLDVTAPAR